MKVVHFTHTGPFRIPPPRISEDQVIVSPNYPPMIEAGRVLAVHAPKGAFDAAPLAEQIIAQSRPDLVVVRTDAFGECRPSNLAAFGCPIALVVGDTHHGSDPISSVLRYALSEPFAACFLDYTRQHAHFFLEAGLPRVHWLPGLNANRIAVRDDQQRQPGVLMLGNVDSWHERRKRICTALRHANLPLRILTADTATTRQWHHDAELNFNCSLNGDLNLRVLEVLQSGGALMTDRLASEAGLDLLFEDGVHLQTYKDAASCVAVARELLADSARRQRMADAGRAQYESRLAPERMTREMLHLLEGAKDRHELDLCHDGRVRIIAQRTMSATLGRRISIYEAFQGVHLRKETISALALPKVPAAAIADLVDLPRLELSRLVVESKDREVAAQLSVAGLSDRIGTTTCSETPEVDLLLATGQDLQNPIVRRLLDRSPNTRIACLDDVDFADRASLGLEPSPEDARLLARPKRTKPKSSKRR